MRRLTILLAAVGALLLVPAAHAFAAPTAKVVIVGDGEGEVTTVGQPMEGSPPIECSTPEPGTGTCEQEMPEVGEESWVSFLHAQAAPNSNFGGWFVESGFDPFGKCAEEPGGEGEADCWVGSGGENTEVVVVFECKVEGTCGPTGPELTVVKEGTGTGTVVSSPAGIECGGTCKASFEEGKVVTLTASPSAGSMFLSWKGCDVGGVNGRKCTVTMSKAKTVVAKFIKSYDVALTKSGSGIGKVSSSPGGVLCLNNCTKTTTAFKEGTSVTLSAVPAKYHTFVEWTGACSGSGTCVLSMSENKSVGAKFEPVAQFGLSVSKSGGGNGTVKSNLAGASCGATCSQITANYYAGTVVELTQTPGKGSTFGGWSGACSGTGSCTVTMSAAKSVNAEFK